MTGWDDGHMDHGRPTDVTVSADGRLFLSNDQNGDIIWVAPISP
jgi:glucose/arabinose dehydrogenase